MPTQRMTKAQKAAQSAQENAAAQERAKSLLSNSGLTDEDAPEDLSQGPQDGQTKSDLDALKQQLGLVDEDAEAGKGPWSESPVELPESSIRQVGRDQTITLPEGISRASVEVDTVRTALLSKVAAPKDRFADRPAHAPIGMDALSQRLGASWYTEDEIFEWALDGEGNRWHFSRYYPIQRVIVDFFNEPALEWDHETADKIAQIMAFNSQAGEKDKVGYLPIYAGDVPTDETLAGALNGEVYALPLRTEGAPFEAVGV